MPKQTVVLVILDGWGIGRNDQSNPIYVAQPQNINYIKHHYPAGSLQASGIAVGLPWNEEGNSEVGHLTLGAGKVLLEHYPRINLTIKDGSFLKNPVLLEAFTHAQKHKSNVNLVGLLGEGNVHSSFEHLLALTKLAEKENVSNFNLHLFTDGKDGPPQGAINLIKKLPQDKIVSLTGRYFAMDRDLHWERTARTYEVLTNHKSQMTNDKQNIEEFLKSFYERGLNDEFVEPTLIKGDRVIKDNDSVIFFNFREDSMRQLVEMFLDPSAGEDPSTLQRVQGRPVFDSEVAQTRGEQGRGATLSTGAQGAEQGRTTSSGQVHLIPKNLYLATFTEYSAKFKLPVAFPGEIITNPLGKVLADNDKVQLRIAETEKYAHITYFFNGFQEPAFKNEYRVLIPSKSVARQDEFPEMMASQVTTRLVSALNEGVYDFILVNYANPDIIAHTGNFDAAIRAIKTIDKEMELLMKAALDNNAFLVITSDHGNAEQMIDPRTGRKETKHDPNQVPIYLIHPGYERDKDGSLVQEIEQGNAGVLSDVAPTILELMGIPKPAQMTGVSLLKLLK